jgi:hypothetical protein
MKMMKLKFKKKMSRQTLNQHLINTKSLTTTKNPNK